MKIVLLSGGSGKRLWPLSNSVMSKQFLKILPTDDGKTESMVQRIYRQIRQYTAEKIIVVAPEFQRDLIMQQLDDSIEFVSEPCRKGTYNAILLACARIVKQLPSEKIVKGIEVNLDNAYIQRKENNSNIIYQDGKAYYTKIDEQVCVIPIDTFVDDRFFSILDDIEHSITTSKKMITLVGITPTYPSIRYGYIIPNSDGYKFCEKPLEIMANEYINNGGLWNSGIFGFSLNMFRYLDEDFVRYHYHSQTDISFDVKICEKTDSISVIKYDGIWKDVGTWDTLSEEIDSYHGRVN